MLVPLLLTALVLSFRTGVPAAVLLLATADRFGVDAGIFWKPFYFFWPLVIAGVLRERARSGRGEFVGSPVTRLSFILLSGGVLLVAMSAWNTGGDPQSVRFLGVVGIMFAFCATYHLRVEYRDEIDRLINAIPLVGAVVGAWGLVVFVAYLADPSATPLADGRPTGIYLDPRYVVPRLCGLAGDPNAWMLQLLPFWTFCWLAPASRRGGVVLWTARALLAANLFLVGSRAGWILAIGVLGSGLVVEGHRRLSRALMVGLLGVLGTVVVLSSVSVVSPDVVELSKERESFAESRLALWGASLREAADHPFLGVGPGLIRESEEMRRAGAGSSGKQTHNAWLELMVEAGIPAFLLVVCGILAPILATMRSVRLRDPGHFALTAIGAAVTVMFLAEMSISYITSVSIWLWLILLLHTRTRVLESRGAP